MRLYKASDAVVEAQARMGREGQTDRLFYCYRCYLCSRLITKLEILEARAAARLNLCPCGSRKIQVTNAKVWEELFLPRVWKLFIALKLKRIALPPPPPTPEEQAEAARVAQKAMYAFETQMKQGARQGMNRV